MSIFHSKISSGTAVLGVGEGENIPFFIGETESVTSLWIACFCIEEEYLDRTCNVVPLSQHFSGPTANR